MAEQRHLHFQTAAFEPGSTSGRTGRSPYYRGAAGEAWQGDTITRKALSRGPQPCQAASSPPGLHTPLLLMRPPQLTSPVLPKSGSCTGRGVGGSEHLRVLCPLSLRGNLGS